MINSVAEQNDPKKRIVTSITVTDNPLTEDVEITTTTPDGWAEKRFKLSTYEKGYYSSRYCGKGSTEEEALGEYETNEIFELTSILRRYFKDPNNSELLEAAELECCGALITPQGGCNWGNIELIKKRGYNVYPGDRDSFGWLTGVVERGGVKLIYG